MLKPTELCTLINVTLWKFCLIFFRLKKYYTAPRIPHHLTAFYIVKNPPLTQRQGLDTTTRFGSFLHSSPGFWARSQPEQSAHFFSCMYHPNCHHLHKRGQISNCSTLASECKPPALKWKLDDNKPLWVITDHKVPMAQSSQISLNTLISKAKLTQLDYMALCSAPKR